MAIKTAYAVIGLGRFGMSVARTLTALGKPVLAIDSRSEPVQAIAPEVEAAMRLDTTDSDALAEISISTFECVIVGIGEASIESSILTTALLSNFAVPRIIARAIHELHGRVLRAVGAHEVVNPEAEIGFRLGQRLAQPNVLERVRLGEDAALVEIETPAKWVGHSLVELNVRNRYDVSVVAIKREGVVNANPKGTERLRADDVLVVIGGQTAIDRISVLV